MINKLKAKGFYVIVKRGNERDRIAGLDIPDSAVIKPNSGIIISVGRSTVDKTIKEGQKAFFNKNSGFIIELESEEEVTVLRENEILFCDDEPKK